MSSSLLEAVYKGSLDEVRKQLRKSDVDVREFDWSCPTIPGSDGFQPLHVAARGGHLQIMKELLAAGADKEGPTGKDDALRPLHVAVRHAHIAAVDLLLATGADVNATSVWSCCSASAAVGR